MIESIKLQNYKAFEDVTIPIKPLTIFVGANSVGKSSIIQMLLHQTAEEVNAAVPHKLFLEERSDRTEVDDLIILSNRLNVE